MLQDNTAVDSDLYKKPQSETVVKKIIFQSSPQISNACYIAFCIGSLIPSVEILYGMSEKYAVAS